MQPIKFFFLHNPKAGGTALRSVLSQIGGGTNAPVFSNGPNSHRHDHDHIQDHIGYDIYAGHYGYDVYSLLNNQHILITNFRDPVSRIYSIYRYWRNNVTIDDLKGTDVQDADIVRCAHEMSFSEFIRLERNDLKLYINNFHFRQIYRSGWQWSDNSRIAQRIVRQRIKQMPWFYIAEMPDASLYLLRNFFPYAGEINIEKTNVTTGIPGQINSRDVDYLIGINLLDYSIHSYACKIQSNRLKQATASASLV